MKRYADKSLKLEFLNGRSDSIVPKELVLKDEVFYPVKESEGVYAISTIGRVYSFPRLVYNLRPGGMTAALRFGKFLKPTKDRDGYLNVTLKLGDNGKVRKIHRLVAENIITNSEHKPCVNHINGIKHDNRVENLEWCTYKENSIHAFGTGLNYGKSGELHPLCRLTEKNVIYILNHPKLKRKKLADKFGTTVSNIKNIRAGNRWKHITTKQKNIEFFPSTTNEKEILFNKEDI